MKILMVTHGFPPECSGGTESYVLRLAQELQDSGHEIHILCGSHEGAGGLTATTSQDTVKGLEVTRVHRGGLYVDDWEKSLAPEVDSILVDVISDFSPDLVHLHHWIRMSRTMVETCHDAGVPTVCTLHDLWSTCPKAFRVRDNSFCELPVGPDSCVGCASQGENMTDGTMRRELALFRDDFANELTLARRLIAPSVAHKETILKHHPKLRGRFRVVPHGNISTLDARPPTAPRAKGALRVGHWGHLSFFKGIDVLLEAVGQLSNPEDITLELFGSTVYPQERARIDELAKDLSIRWHGSFVPKDLINVKMDLAVIPTRCSESWSFVLDEAFLLGLPVIASDLGSLPERLQGAGEVFRVGDAADLARVLQEAVDNRDRLEAWSTRIPKLPLMRRHAQAIDRVYDEVLSSRAKLPTTSLALRNRRLADRVALVEERNRQIEERIGYGKDMANSYRKSKEGMKEQAYYLGEKDKVITYLEGEVERLKSDERPAIDSVELEGLRVQIATATAQASTLKQTVNDQDMQIARLSQEIEAAGTRPLRRELLDQQTKALHDVHKEWTQRAETAKAQLEALEGVRVDLMNKWESAGLRERAAELDARERSESLEAEASSLKTALEQRENQLHEMSAAMEGLLEQLAHLERKRRPGIQASADGTSVTTGAALAPTDARPAERLKVLMVVHQFLPQHVAGTEIYTAALAQQLRSNLDVVLLTAESDHSRPRFERTRRNYAGIPIHQVIHNYQWENFRETYDCPEADAIFRRILSEEKPDVLHIQHLHYFSMNFITIAKQRGIPVVYTLHDYILMCPRDGTLRRADGEICEQPIPSKCRDCIEHFTLDENPLPVLPRALSPGASGLVPEPVAEIIHSARRDHQEASDDPYTAAAADRLEYMRRVLKDVDLFISPSSFLRTKMVDSGLVNADRIIASDNGYELDRLPKPEDRAPSYITGSKDLPAQLRVTYVGTLSEHKGVHLLVEAMNDIDDPRISCQIWGDLTAFFEYSDHLQGLNQNPRTLLMGPFPAQSISEVLKQTDLLVIPSLWFENSPLTVHEAARAGVPVLASDRGGLAEYVIPEVTGRHFALGDVHDLRAKIVSFLESPLGSFDPDALQVKDIADDARDMEQRYLTLLERARSVAAP